MSVIHLLKAELNNTNAMTTTENGDFAYVSSGNANLDFFGLAAACRHNQAQVLSLFQKAFSENRELALKNMLYLRDIRGGLGERDSFRTCFRYLCKKHRKYAVRLFPAIQKYGRYDDFWSTLGSPAEKEMIALIEKQLQSDIANYNEGKPYSLLSKWLPSINAGSSDARAKGLLLAARLGYTKAGYRKILTRLRKGKIIENHLREGDFSFSYESVPAKALSKYRSTFEKKDTARYQDFIRLALTNPAAIKTGTLFPYDIIGEYSKNMTSLQKKAMQAKWNALPRSSDASSTLVVRDGSGSMAYCQNGLPLKIATSLAILFAEQLTGVFANHFITFSAKPELVELPSTWDLSQKLAYSYTFDDYTNTDISKVYDLVLQTSLKINNPKDYIQRIVIISDMEFDAGTENVPTYESMRHRFETANIPLPEVIYWNVNSRHPHFAARADQPNIRFVSGASHHVIDAILGGKDTNAVAMMERVLERYGVGEELI